MVTDIPLTPAELPPPEAQLGRFFLDVPALLDESAWLELRGRGARPSACSDLVTSVEARAEFLTGAELTRNAGPRALRGLQGLRQPHPQQLLIADMLGAGHKRNGILVPRRSTKTASVLDVAIGRAAHREDYRVGVMDTRSGKAGIARFAADVATPIEQLYPDKRSRPVKVIRAAGAPGLHFDDGGSVRWLHTLADVRGEAFDLLILDEGGEVNEPERIEDILAAALPTLDTRPAGQIVVLGTAGRTRTNLLWEALELGRSGVGGIVEFAASDATTAEELEAWEPDEDHPEARVRALVELHHPGVGTTTTLDTIRDNYLAMPLERFAAEYLGIFGTDGGTSGIFDLERWTACGTAADQPPLPERFSLAFVVHPFALRASIVSTWRDEDGRAVAALLENRAGVEWLPKALHDIARKYRVPVVYDTGSQQARLVVDRLNREQTRPRFEPQTWMDVKKAAALLVQEVAKGNVIHYRQDDLESAVRLAVKRAGGAGEGWALGRPKTDPDADITAAEAWALALLVYDATKPRQRMRSRVAT